MSETVVVPWIDGTERDVPVGSYLLVQKKTWFYQQVVRTAPGGYACLSDKEVYSFESADFEGVSVLSVKDDPPIYFEFPTKSGSVIADRSGLLFLTTQGLWVSDDCVITHRKNLKHVRV